MCLQSHHEPIQYQCPFRGSFKKVKYSHLRPVKSEKHPQTINNHTQFGHQVSDTSASWEIWILWLLFWTQTQSWTSSVPIFTVESRIRNVKFRFTISFPRMDIRGLVTEDKMGPYLKWSIKLNLYSRLDRSLIKENICQSDFLPPNHGLPSLQMTKGYDWLLMSMRNWSFLKIPGWSSWSTLHNFHIFWLSHESGFGYRKILSLSRGQIFHLWHFTLISFCLSVLQWWCPVFARFSGY